MNYVAKEKEKISVKGFGKSQEITNVALFLASDEAIFVSRCIIEVDGG